jgi:molybdate transport system permease protein
VTLPLAWPGVLAGAVLSFARGLGEFGATIILAGRQPGVTETIPLAIYSALEAPGQESRIRFLILASLVLCLAAVVATRALDGWHRRRLELNR